MTEPARAVPGGGLRALPVRPLPERTPGAATLKVVPPRTAARPAAATRRPIHVVVAVGMTAGLYAVSLAGVTALQSASDSQLAADSAPAAGAVAQLRSTHDAMENSLAKLSDAYTKAASGYQAITAGIAGHEHALATLGRQVTAAARSAAALSVPTFSRAPAISGGATGGSRPAAALSVPSVSVPSIAALPAVSTSAAVVSSRPVVNACTTASGKPC